MKASGCQLTWASAYITEPSLLVSGPLEQKSVCSKSATRPVQSSVRELMYRRPRRTLQSPHIQSVFSEDLVSGNPRVGEPSSRPLRSKVSKPPEVLASSSSYLSSIEVIHWMRNWPKPVSAVVRTRLRSTPEVLIPPMLPRTPWMLVIVPLGLRLIASQKMSSSVLIHPFSRSWASGAWMASLTSTS